MSGDRVISRADLEAAVAAGVIDTTVADRLLAFVKPPDRLQADEENLRLISSFNDIFVTIGLALFLGALGRIGSNYSTSAGAFGVAVACWLLAEIFIRRKRMALPSIVLLAAFGFASFFGIARWLEPGAYYLYGAPASALAVAGIGTTALIGLHWWRFRVPITIAAGCGTLAIAVIGLALGRAPEWFAVHPVLIFLPIGLVIFVLAMAFDMSDRRRLTRRTDIAFWLHLLAAPMIVHPIIAEWAPLYDRTPANSGVILALFLILGIVALIIDRRALLVSSLSYLIYAAYALLAATSQAYGAAPAVLAVGSIVLLLSVAWRPLRRLVLQLVPGGIRHRVPEPA